MQEKTAGGTPAAPIKLDVSVRDVYKRQVYEVDGSDTDEEADLLNFDDLDSDEFV